MLRLNETNVEVLKFLTAEHRDPVHFVSRRTRNLIDAYADVLPVRNLNLRVDDYQHGANYKEYILDYSTDAGLRTHRYETEVLTEEQQHYDYTEATRQLEPYLKGCWVSYITIRSEVCQSYYSPHLHKNNFFS